MTPAHPQKLGTHRRIADLIERGVSDVPRIAERLSMQPASVTIALAKMAELGYVARVGSRPQPSGRGRASIVWAVVPGAVIPIDSGSVSGTKRKDPGVYVSRVVDALRAGPTTRNALIKAASLAWTQLEDVVDFLMAEGCVTRSYGATGGRPAFIYTLVREPVDPSAATVRVATRPAVEAPEEERYEGSSGTFVLETVPSTETVRCNPAKTTVLLAACIDSYVSDTARDAPSKCNGCRYGRARRAAYAGCDFEESDDE